jgi:hypothetical protein
MERLRYHILIFFLFLGSSSTAQQYILSQPFSFSFNQTPLESVLDSITLVTGYSFSYNPAITNTVKAVTANYSNPAALKLH